MRARLLAQLNQVLQTRDTARGLIVSMPDVLFDFNKYTLKPEAGSGWPGYRDRAGLSGFAAGDRWVYGFDRERYEYNQTLSDKTAEAVRITLWTSGVSMNNVVARGMGKADPVADNTTAQGRQLNRRVEMIVSGDVDWDAGGTWG